MKKLLVITAILLPLALQANPIPSPQLNPQAVAAMLQIQQQIVNAQQQILILQKQQLAIQRNLFIQTTQPVNADFKWITVPPNGNAIPANRINAGLTGGPAVYICHAQYQNLGVHPGTLTADGCLISYAGNSYTEKNYQVLTGTGKISWRASTFVPRFNPPGIFGGPGPVIMPGIQAQNNFQTMPIIGGREQGHNLYVCRTIVDNAMHVGKVVFNNCNVGYQGKELMQRDFQVLFSDGGT